MFEDLSETRWLPRIVDWGRETATGDRAEIDDLPDGLRLWHAVNAKADTCTGSRCPEYEECWLTRMKRTAQQSQIVVVNHHLFFADLGVRSAYGSVLPDYDTVIFDEAHLVEEVATLYLGTRRSPRDRSRSWPARRRSLAARAGETDQAEVGRRRNCVWPRIGVFPAAARTAGTAEARSGALRRRTDRGGPDLEGEWAVLSESLDEVERQAAGNEASRETVESLARRAEDLREDLARVLDRDNSGYVYGMELRGRRNVVLSAAPIDVSGLLRDELFANLDAAVLTSATLTVQGKFDFFASRLGLEDADALAVESSFDYADQAVLYLPRGMPEPRQPEFVDRAVEQFARLAEITDGRAFLLFTSYANLERAHDELARLDRWPLIVQGEGSKLALVEAFKSTPRSVLLGTTAFWHGVDVPGAALSLVAIDKLPFDVPSDPLIAARIERIREDQGNPFMDYQVPLAVLELKQGLGRLLRGRRDRGLLAVLDPRLTTKRYGKVFLGSLPDYARAHDVQDCARFFNRPVT